MKVGVTGFPPLTFRMLSMWIGLSVFFWRKRYLGGIRH